MNESDLERRVADVLRKRSEDAMRAVHVEEDLDTLRRRAKREARSRRTLGVAAVLVMLVAGAGAAVLLPERGSSAPDSAAAAPPSASADATPASNAPTDPHGVLDLLGLSTDELRLRRLPERQRLEWGDSQRHVLPARGPPRSGVPRGAERRRLFPRWLRRRRGLVQRYSGPGGTYSNDPVFADLPIGSLIRFVLTGDHVNVYVTASKG